MADGEKSVQDLEKPEPLSHQRREWLVERIGWAVAGLLLAAGLLGYLGRGPLTWTRIASEDQSLALEYYWTEHYQADSELRMFVDESAGSEDAVRIAVARSFLDETTVQGIWPPPVSTEAEEDRLIFTFKLGKKPAERKIVYHYKHETYGPLSGEIAVVGHPPAAISQFVFP